MTDGLDTQAFRRHAHEVVDWIADYFEAVESFPVRSQAQPGDLLKMLPERAPEQPESMERILDDFKRLIPPGLTHWQHPSFFAYFPANSSSPSVLAEMLTAGIAAQCMLWETSPAANELEARMMEWLRDLLGLPGGWRGVIQDSASGATLCALLAARERTRARASLDSQVFYTSGEANSSVHKGARIAGFPADCIRSIETDANQSMVPGALGQAIAADRQAGRAPGCVVVTIGTTGTGASDPLAEIGAICRRENIYLHVDAAWAGSALILPEWRHLLNGVEHADSFVFNPHKWMFTNFDCSAHFLKDPESLQRSLSIDPVYLQNSRDEEITEYRDYGISLGRRFRALKLWFVLRAFGAEGLREKIRAHIRWTEELAQAIQAAEHFELVTGPNLALVTWRYAPPTAKPETLDALNTRLLKAINDDGRLYLTPGAVDGRRVIRFAVGQTRTEERHVRQAWKIIQEIAATL
ncbi:pyridoxal phosphate-dependent decarboxylase family protein [Candidatus Foliamicus sp.]